VNKLNSLFYIWPGRLQPVVRQRSRQSSPNAGNEAVAHFLGEVWITGQFGLQQAEIKAPQVASIPASSLIPLPMLATQTCCSSELPVVFKFLTTPAAPAACGCNAAVSTDEPQKAAGSCDTGAWSTAVQTLPEWTEFLNEVRVTGVRLLVLFTGFAFIGYFINGLIPASWISRLFGSGNLYSVPLAATLGLPFHLNTEATLPLIRALLVSGMSSGAALAPLSAPLPAR
jgi:uncharacterized membrane protein YraQ (UPF0718 family)